MLLFREDKRNVLRAIRIFKALLLKSWDSAIDSPKNLSISTLKEKTDFLYDYVEIEKMRLNTKVNFTISRSDNLFDNYTIPSLLIQPLVENALWHGINDTESSNVNLHFEAVETSNTLEITVTDDGKGLDNEPKKENTRKSFGLKILKERLLLISEDSVFSVENRDSIKGYISRLTIYLIPQIDIDLAIWDLGHQIISRISYLQNQTPLPFQP